MYKYLQESELNGDGEGMDKVKVNLLGCKNTADVWGIYLEVKKGYTFIFELFSKVKSILRGQKTHIMFAMNKRKSMTKKRKK